MKRLILTVTGTVAGVVALLSFKSEGHPLTTGALPSAGINGRSEVGTAPSTGVTAPTGSASTRSHAASPRPSAAARSYTGSAITTRYGIVQVKVAVAGGKITSVAFVQLTADDPRSQQINSGAGPRLLQETLSGQSAQVDTVSGASYTSDGYRRSLQSALDQAGVR